MAKSILSIGNGGATQIRKPPTDLIPLDMQAKIEACDSFDKAKALLQESAKANTTTLSRYMHPIITGWLYRKVMDGKWLGTGRDQASKDAITKRNNEIVTETGYSLVYVRACARLYADWDMILEAIEFYEDNKDELTNKPRKAEGLDYALSCIKALKAYEKVIDANGSEEEALIEADKALPPPPITRVTGPISEVEKMKRKDAMIAAFFVQAKKISKELGGSDASAFLDRFNTLADLFSEIENRPYSEAEDAQYTKIKTNLDLETTDFLPIGTELLEIVNNSWGIVRDQTTALLPGASSTHALTATASATEGNTDDQPLFVFSMTGLEDTHDLATKASRKRAREIGWTGYGKTLDRHITIEQTEGGFKWTVDPLPTDTTDKPTDDKA